MGTAEAGLLEVGVAEDGLLEVGAVDRRSYVRVRVDGGGTQLGSRDMELRVRRQ